jgi:hypothetical protein
VRTRSAEFSAETRPWRPWVTSLTFWRLELEAEVLFDPLASAFTTRGPARHHGVEFYNEVKGGPWKGEVCWSWNQAAFKDEPAGFDHVPGSVPHTGYVGVGWKGQSLSVDLHWRRTGVRPLTLDDSRTADRQDAVELRVQQDWQAWSVALEVLNVFSRKTYNQEYFYTSRLPGEGAGGVADRHLKPADPQTIRVELRRRF